MHMLIRGLVYAGSMDEALSNAQSKIFNDLVTTGLFDYYTTFNGDSTNESDYPAAMKAESEPGKTLIQDGWEKTVQEYELNIEQITELFDTYEAEKLWQDEDLHQQYRSAFAGVGEHRGSSTWLYDQGGAGIRTKPHLDDVLENWRSLYETDENNPYIDKNVWVVPADVHF